MSEDKLYSDEYMDAPFDLTIEDLAAICNFDRRSLLFRCIEKSMNSIKQWMGQISKS
jgi:hypothetical protein